MSSEPASCARCGTKIDAAECFIVRDAVGPNTAHLCRLEHIVAWVLRGADWQLERPWDVPEAERNATGAVNLERVRAGAASITEFDDVDALRRWASAGGPWAAAQKNS